MIEHISASAKRPLTRSDCRFAVAMHHAQSAPQILSAAAARYAAGDCDLYGTGDALNAFERRIADRLGKEAAVFMPSGTMAQQIVLRIVADRNASRAFAAHPTNHVVLHERDGYTRLHDLRFIPLGSASRLLSPDDLHALAEPVATLLIELPQREIGGQLPAWDELIAISNYAREHGLHVHLGRCAIVGVCSVLRAFVC